MIRAIIFDCFGVLCTEGWMPFKRKYFGHDEARMQEASDLSKQLNRGMLSDTMFVDQIAELAGVSPAEARRAMQSNVADEELLAYIKSELKSRYKIGLLSNAGGNYLDELFTPDQVALFNATLLSFETGSVKPDKRAYTEAAAALGVQPEECVFVDDQQRHCEGARAAGMSAIVYQDVDRLKAELKSFIYSGDTKD